MDRARQRPRSDDPTAAEIHVAGGPTCPLCLESITALPRLEVCSGCRSIHHLACVEEMGRCGTPGCQGLNRPPPPEMPPEWRALGALAWALNLVGGGFVGPLVIYILARRHDNAFVRYQARQSLLLAILVFVLALPTLGLAVLAWLAISVVAALRAYRGEWWSLPLVGRGPPPEALAARARADRPAVAEAPRPGVETKQAKKGL